MTTIRGPWTLGTNLTATGDAVDASGGGITGLGTPGYVAVWSSPTNLATSSIADNGVDVTLTGGSLKSPDQPGTYGNGVSLTVQAGASGSAGGYGGYTYIRGGADYGVGGPGPVNIYAGSGFYYDNPGAAVNIGAGHGFGNGQGAPVGILAGFSTGTAGAGIVLIAGGASSGAGNAGGVDLAGGAAVAGKSGDIALNTQAGGGGAGNVNISSYGTVGITTLAGRLLIDGLPTSAAGLPSGAIWLNANVLTRVP